MVGAYAAFFVLGALGSGPLGMLLAFVVSMILCAGFGITIERLA
jgi:branched-subunit amino acid ABC-type transport system permease component